MGIAAVTAFEPSFFADSPPCARAALFDPVPRIKISLGVGEYHHIWRRSGRPDMPRQRSSLAEKADAVLNSSLSQSMMGGEASFRTCVWCVGRRAGWVVDSVGEAEEVSGEAGPWLCGGNTAGGVNGAFPKVSRARRGRRHAGCTAPPNARFGVMLVLVVACMMINIGENIRF